MPWFVKPIGVPCISMLERGLVLLVLQFDIVHDVFGSRLEDLKRIAQMQVSGYQIEDYIMVDTRMM